MRLTREEYSFALNKFGTQVADRIMQRQAADELRFIVGRLRMAREADELRSQGYSIHTVVPADTSQTVVKVSNSNSSGQFVLAGSNAYRIVNDALHGRDGFMSDYVPLTLEDVLLSTLPKPFYLK